MSSRTSLELEDTELTALIAMASKRSEKLCGNGEVSLQYAPAYGNGSAFWTAIAGRIFHGDFNYSVAKFHGTGRSATQAIQALLLEMRDT